MEKKAALKTKSLKINTTKCRGELKLLKKVIIAHKWEETLYNDADIYWSGLDLPANEYWKGIDSRVNRLPGMKLICHKKMTYYILNKFAAYYSNAFDFFPRTFLIPEEYEQFNNYAKSQNNAYFISKPTAGSQGEGIRIFKGGSDMDTFFLDCTKNEVVIQDYIAKPLILNNLKFDLRLYIFIASLDPFIAFLSDEGLARFCSESYESPNSENMKKAFTHLTNYSLNKVSKSYKYTEECVLENDGSKRTLCSFWKTLEKHGILRETVWNNIKEFLPALLEAIKMFLKFFSSCTFEKKDKNQCFHIIGADVLIDENLKPWLLELNSNPSLSIDFDTEFMSGKPGIESPVDVFVKEKVVGDALKYFTFKKNDRKNLDRIGSYELITSSENTSNQFGIFANILEIFKNLSGCIFTSELKSSSFVKLCSLITLPEFKELKKIDYDLIFQKTKMVDGAMDIFGFIYSLEVLCRKAYKKKFDDNKCEIMESLTKHILLKYQSKSNIKQTYQIN